MKLSDNESMSPLGWPTVCEPSRFSWLKASVLAHESDECLLWPFGKDGFGYGACALPDRIWNQIQPRTKKGNPVQVHRIAFYLANGHWPEPQARHTCDCPACFNPAHLIEGTQADNMRDAVERSRQVHGSRNGRAKLDEATVLRMRAEAGTLKSLARKYGVHETTVGRILRRRRWQQI